MTEATKEKTRKLTEAVESLPEAERKYVLGLAEGIAIANKGKTEDEAKDEPQKGRRVQAARKEGRERGVM